MKIILLLCIFALTVGKFTITEKDGKQAETSDILVAKKQEKLPKQGVIALLQEANNENEKVRTFEAKVVFVFFVALLIVILAGTYVIVRTIRYTCVKGATTICNLVKGNKEEKEEAVSLTEDWFNAAKTFIKRTLKGEKEVVKEGKEERILVN